MKLRALNHQVPVKDKVVLVRIDGDVPIVKGTVQEGSMGRLTHAAVTLQWLRQRGAKIVVLAHRGRPEGKRVAALSLAPVVKRLDQLLGGGGMLSKEMTGPRVEKKVGAMERGDILLLENTRFAPGEQADDKGLAAKWAALGDMYVNNAFAVSHRAHASVHALATLLPAYAGLRLMHEVTVLDRVRTKPRLPIVVVMGGAKVHTKIGTLRAFLKQGAILCVGGALAHAFFAAEGLEIGRSLLSKEDLPHARDLLKRYRAQVILPTDVVVTHAIRRRSPIRSVPISAIEKRDYIVDLGPETRKRFGAHIAAAKTLVWNGPLGLCEIPDFCEGTRSLVRKMGAMKGKARTIVGGGDTVPLLDAFGVANKFDLVSTGGGAMMMFLAGEHLPGLETLT